MDREDPTGSDEAPKASPGAFGMPDQELQGDKREQATGAGSLTRSIRCIPHMLSFLQRSHVSSFILKPLVRSLAVTTGNTITGTPS